MSCHFPDRKSYFPQGGELTLSSCMQFAVIVVHLCVDAVDTLISCLHLQWQRKKERVEPGAAFHIFSVVSACAVLLE